MTLAEIPDPKPWPSWDVHSRGGKTATARPLPCRRCGDPVLADHRCLETETESRHA